MSRPELYVAVDPQALRFNYRAVESLVGKTPICAVVKGNGFGHGTLLAGRIFREAGAAVLGVSRLSEAQELREGGVEGRIWVMVPPGPAGAELARRLDVEVTVDSEDAIEAFRGRPMHLEIDTGMGRLGCAPDRAAELARAAGSDLMAAFTHFARATDASTSATKAQLRTFLDAARPLKVPLHAANSAALVRVPESRLDMVRPGTMLYGQKTWGAGGPELKSGWSLRARVIAIHERPAGTPIGYGSEETTKSATRIATLAVGTADGFEVAPVGPLYRMSPVKFAFKKQNRNVAVTIGKHLCPVVGRVSMQLTTVEIGDHDIKVGEYATVPALRLMVGAHVPRLLDMG